MKEKHEVGKKLVITGIAMVICAFVILVHTPLLEWAFWACIAFAVFFIVIGCVIFIHGKDD